MGRTRPGYLVLALLTLPLLAGCLGTPPPATPPLGPGPEAPSSATPRVVIAVIDTGINVYHAEYRRQASLAPLSLREGVEAPAPVGAVVPLSLGASWKDAMRADKDALMALEPKTLYSFPGTKILGAISFMDKPEDWPLILDRPNFYTHGTMTSSRAVGNSVSIGGLEDGIQLVLVQGFNAEAVRWAAEQPWIDIVSISAGISPLSMAPLAPNLLDTEAIPAYRDASHAKPFFASTGNGVTNGGFLGFPSWWRGSSGVPDAISVGANDNDQMSHWHNQDPYISADGCRNPAAVAGDAEEIANTGGGTSSATPFSAGGGARMLLEARRLLGDTGVGPVRDDSLAAPEGWDSLSSTDPFVVLARGPAGLVEKGPLADGVFTLLEFKDVLYHTALATPTDDDSDGDRCDPATIAGNPNAAFGGTYLPGNALPEDQRFFFQGYGEVNHASIGAALEVLRGEADLPARPGADAEYARAHHLKSFWTDGS